MAIYYFAYGSNMASERLLARIPGARKVCNAVLPDHRLRFRKSDSGKSGKCDIEVTGNRLDRVHGVVYQIPDQDKAILDRYEGLGVGYNDKLVELNSENKQVLSAFTYYALLIDEAMIPYHWYKGHVLHGAIEHQLPADYISIIEAVPSKKDPDTARSVHELAI
jgi:cation transport regulator ChaC